MSETKIAEKGAAIYPAMIAIAAEIPSIAKAQKNTAQGYVFRGVDDVFNALQPILSRNGVFMLCEILDLKREERPSKSGGVIAFVTTKVRYSFVAKDGSSVSTESAGEGADSGDKATAKSLSIAMKYALLQSFMVPTADPKDPEVDNPEPAPKSTPPASRPPSDKTLSEKGKEVRDDLGAMLLEMANSDKDVAAELLGKYSAFTNSEGEEVKATTLARMSEKWIKSTYGKVKKDYEAIGADREPGEDYE